MGLNGLQAAPGRLRGDPRNWLAAVVDAYVGENIALITIATENHRAAVVAVRLRGASSPRASWRPRRSSWQWPRGLACK